jgi:predicted transglutaminase-like cysteine proteinase
MELACKPPAEVMKEETTTWQIDNSLRTFGRDNLIREHEYQRSVEARSLQSRAASARAYSMKIIYLTMALGVSTTFIGHDEVWALSPGPSPIAPIAEAVPTLAPFQHVRFCLRHPSECKPTTAGGEPIQLDDPTMELLKHINHDINAAIAPTVKTYGANLQDSWTISPASGDCNDYAVTKRHELLDRGLPSNALRLSVVRTPTGIGHLVLVVVTTKGDLVMDNLTGAIRNWHQTKYQWLKIQSSSDPKLWYDVIHSFESSALAAAGRHVRLANR